MSEAYKKPVIIDTDPGDDDAASILWAIACDQFDIKALTISNGNVGVDKCVINALRTLEIAKRTDIPVYGGAYRPLVRPPIEASWIHGKDGFGDLGFPMPVTKPGDGYAPVEMIRIAKESKEPVTILTLGPLTNVALAILLDKDFLNHVKEILFMGGTLRFTGNESPRASYNAKVDPEAAKVVYNCGVPVVQLGLDVCDLVTQTVEDLEAIGRAGTPVTDFLIKLLSFRKDKATKPIYDAKGNLVRTLRAADQVETRMGGIGLNDLTATAYLVNPGWFKTMYVTMDVETHGLCDGETIIDYKGLWGREPTGYFAYDVDGKALVAKWVSDMTNYRP
jgi:inosine-uridine nucleoside N-ribohydrolase